MIKQKRGKNKKAIFFSLDALIALVVIILSITVIYPIVKYSEKKSYVPEDILSSLSTLKIGEMGINNAYVQGLIDTGEIADLNKSVLEQMGEFYVSDETKPMAEELARQVLLTISTNENIGIWIGNNPNPIASKNKIDYDEAKNVDAERQIISGIKEGEEITGFSARAFLSNNEQTQYYYFGGYVGEGNITINVNYNGTLSKVELEIAANKDFKICINEEENGCSGSFEPAISELEPKYFDLTTGYLSLFNEGKNAFKIVPIDGINNLHIAGGHLKLTYSDGVQYEKPIKYYFPGIEGIINLYDGFYVPGNLTNLEVHLKARIDDPAKNMFMRLGDTLIFNISTGGALMDIDYDNAQINSIITAAGKDYSDYSKKTIPIRIAIDGVDYLETDVLAEVFSSPSLSASSSSATLKAIVDGTEYTKFEAVKKTNEKLVELILGIDGDVWMGLTPTGAGGIIPSNMYHELSQDQASLTSTIENEWDKGNIKDICAGMQRPFDDFNEESNFRAIVLTVFDEPEQCREWEDEFELIEEGTLIEKIKNKICGLVDPDGPGGNDSEVRIYTVDVGLSSPAEDESIQLLKDLANCSNGKYIHTEVYGMMDAYDDIFTEIVSLIYNMQIIDVIASVNASSYLSPDSYIEFNYERTESPYGIIINSEKIFDNEDSGSFSIQPDSEMVETKVISYSGSKWTQHVLANNIVIYNLSDYGEGYVDFGDPYLINIPNNYILENNTVNIVEVTTGLSPTNSSPGSSFNKIIYTVVKDMSSYSAISSYANGCNWNIQFEDDSFLSLQIPPGATDLCYYTSENFLEPNNDALKIAVYNLFKKLDSDDPPNGKINLKFEEQNLQVSSSEIIGIPYPWETVIHVRKWW